MNSWAKPPTIHGLAQRSAAKAILRGPRCRSDQRALPHKLALHLAHRRLSTPARLLRRRHTRGVTGGEGGPHHTRRPKGARVGTYEPSGGPEVVTVDRAQSVERDVVEGLPRDRRVLRRADAMVILD